MESPQTIIAAVTAVAVALSEGRSSQELVQLAAIFNQLSSTLTNIAVAMSELEIISNDGTTSAPL